MNLKRKGFQVVISELLILILVVILASIAASFIMGLTKKGEVIVYKKGEKELMCREGIAWEILEINGTNVTIRNTGAYPIKLSEFEAYATDILSLGGGRGIKITGWSKEILGYWEIGNITLEIDPFSLNRSYLVIEDPCGIRKVYPLYPLYPPGPPPPAFLPVMCWIENGSCSSGVCVFALSSLQNAHLENCSEGNYQYKLCCENISDVSVSSGTCPLGYTGFLTLSSLTNAHAEEYGYSGSDGFSEKYNVCVKPMFGSLTGNYTTNLSACLSTGGMPLFSLSAETNAHVGNLTQYPIVFCYSQS